MNIQDKVQELTSNDYEFKFGEYFSRGWQLFGKKPGHYIGFFALTMLMLMVTAFIPLVGSIGAQILGGVLMVGFFAFSRNIQYNNNPSFDDLFKAFNSFGKIAVIQLIILGFTIVIIMPLLIFGFANFFSGFLDLIQNPDYYDNNPAAILEMFDLEAMIPLAIITYLFLFFIQTIYMFANPIAHFFNASAWDSMEASRKIIQKKFFHFFGLIILLAIMNFAGAMCFFIGLIVTIPLTFNTMYAAFDDILKPTETGNDSLADENSFEKRAN
jgi:uncharacterized membrane protein